MFMPWVSQEKDRQRKTRKRDQQMKQLGISFKVRTRTTNHPHAVFTCSVCGVNFIASMHRVKSGHTTSCGCKRAHTRRMLGQIDGRSKTREYKIWALMLDRCRNPNGKSWGYYGGRGITVCDRWLSFDNFLADMGVSSKAQSIDRVNNDGNYCPDNCRWTTQLTQMRNCRKNTLLTVDGISQPMSVWAESKGAAKYSTIRSRKRLGWSDREAIFGKNREGRSHE